MIYKAVMMKFVGAVIFIFCLAQAVRAGTLACVVRVDSCVGDEVVVLRMSSTTNAHAEIASQSSFNQLVCCGGVIGLGNTCAGDFSQVLRLSADTNAHVEQNTYTTATYATSSACLSVSPDDSISVDYKSGDCSGYDTIVASMSSSTNAHVGEPGAYDTKICATANNNIISVSVSDGVVTYGLLQANATDNTVNLVDTQTATNTGDVAESFKIKGQNASGGGCTWALAGTTGSDQYMHEFSSDGGTDWTPLSALYQDLATSVGTSSSQAFDLRITTPTDSTCFGEQSANVTVLAVQN